MATPYETTETAVRLQVVYLLVAVAQSIVKVPLHRRPRSRADEAAASAQGDLIPS